MFQRRRTPAPAGDLSAARAHRNLLVTSDGTWAWFVLGEVDWMFRPEEGRESALTDATSRLADLTGHRVCYRVTSAPFNRRAWVERLGRDFPAATRPGDVPGTATFDDVLASAQEFILDAGARSTAALFAVRVTEERLDDAGLRAVLSPDALSERMGLLDDVRRDVRFVTGVVAKEGLRGSPMSANALGWLMHASVGLGLPVPPVLLSGKRDGWVDDEMAGFTAGVAVTSSPYSASTTVQSVRAGVEQTRHVTVLHVAKFDPRPDTGWLPWMAWFQTLPYGVDLVGVFDIVAPAAVRKRAEQDRRLAEDIMGHFESVGDSPPARTARAHRRAVEVEDEVTNGDRTAARARGVVMVAVTGATPEDTREVANDLASQAAEQGMTLAVGIDQYGSARGFVPGEPVSMTGFVTQQEVAFLAAGVANASTRCGDGTGWLVGPVAGGHDVMLFDPWGGAGRDRSNLRAVGADPGSGKSTTGAALLDWSTRCGVRSIGFDPAGQWQALTRLPHLRGVARNLDLFSARKGILTPSMLIVEPRRQDFDTDDGWRDAVSVAAQDRMALTIDTLTGLLPFGLVGGDVTGRVAGVVEAAVTDGGGGYGEDPWQVVDRIRSAGGVGEDVARLLTTRAELRDGALIFPARTRGPDDEVIRAELDRALLTIISLQGLALPPKDNPDRASWTQQQRAAVPILNLTSYLAVRAMYADRARTSIHMDEMSVVTGGAGGSFGAALTRWSTDSRKWNTDVSLYFQNPGMLLRVDPEIANLVGSAWVGRMSEGAAVAALELLRLKPGAGVEKVIAGLEQGTFLIRDWVGRVRKVQVDRSWWDEATLAMIDTNPHGEGNYDGADLPGVFEQVPV